jgi:PAS domain S-box-containing protein
VFSLTSDLRHPHVLVVDDDPDTRELYDIMLSSVGYHVGMAATVRAATELLARTAPRVVITDWRLPDGDGFDVADALRASHAKGAQIVGVTGASLTRALREEALERGFSTILLKPVMPDEILQAVSQALEAGTARELRQAAVRLRRYASHASKLGARATGCARIDAACLLRRAAERSGEHIALVLADDEAHYVAASIGAREITGYEPQELLSLSVWDLTPPPLASSGEGLWSSFIASGSQEGRYTLRRRDGVPVEAQYCAIANIVPGLHVSAFAHASQVPATL